MLARPIYLDNHSTTPLDSRVLAAMLPYFGECFGNPSSKTHLYGWEAAAAVEQARADIASLLGAAPEEIIFTSGATESNNLAIKGVAEAYYDRGKHFITVQTEHRAVLDPLRYLESLGFTVTYLPVDGEGLIDPEDVAKAIRGDTVLVSVMAANNEIGVLQDLGAIGRICKARGVLFHTDAAQAVGKVPLDVEALGIDLLSFTAHKCHGPKGIGGLYVRQNPKVQIAPQLHGGGQEGGLRSGTLYPPQIVGMAKALTLAVEQQTQEQQYIRQLRERLWSQLQALPDIYLNGHWENRLAGNLNVSFGGIRGDTLLAALRQSVALSSGSACSSSSPQPSHVLTAIGRSPQLAAASLRFGISRFNTAVEIDRVAQLVIEQVQALRTSF
ncbi:MAG: cysteine desulfurase family protein [Pseudanabaenaceae cyanobacterium SKYGB_i_bin29]|nr:cysteine desulfurase [Pseudanabaenaceae cyanobacterium SKYG29]MDW8422509.1 cysteine desulfurase family protein [Pseudanabaenaceae cyanobacterium SKYGB_i_bin29]